MKKTLALLSLVAFALSASAQTTTVTAGNGTSQTYTNGIPNFLNQAAVWGTSFNTNYSWSSATIEIEDGYKQTTGSGAADYLRFQYDVGRWNISAEGQFFGIGSQFNSVEVGGGYAVISKFDFKLEANLLAGYDRQRRFEVEPEIKVSKMMTINTYATIGLSVPWYSRGSFDGTPQFRGGFGFFF